MERFGIDPVRRGCRTAVGVVLVAVALLVAPTPARAQSSAVVGGDIFDCGGRGEPACPAFSKFWENGNFGCDRGLKEEQGICVNDKRRQGVGRQFRESDLGRALAMQRRLNWDRPIGLHSDISVHNAYENHADGYPGGSQRYSITEMLDAGFRQIELDVWTDTLGLGHPKLCHGACSGHDRFFSSALKELRDWLKEDGHENEVVIVLFDGYGFDADQVDLVDASIKAHLADDPAIGVYTGPSRWNSGPNPSQSSTAWPSPAEMVRNGTRVLFLIQADSVGAYLKKERWGSMALSTGDNGGVKPTVVVGYPTCELVITKNTGTLTTPVLSDTRINIAPKGNDDGIWMIKEVYPGAYLPTGEQLQNLASCGLDSIKMNYLLQTTQQDANSNGDPERLEKGVWSWAAGQPSITAPGTAVQIHDDAVYAPSMHAHHPDDVAPYLCNDPGAFPSLTLSVVGSGPWHGGFSACSAVGLEFYAPRTGYEANKAIDAIPDNSKVWIALQTTGGVEGFDVREAGKSAIAVWDLANLGGRFEGVPAHMSIVSTEIITSVEWQFGDGTVVTREGDNAFPNFVEHTWASAGSYTIRAKLKLGTAVVKELSKTITVLQLSDLPFGPGIALDSRSTSITEGQRTFALVSSRWPIVGLQCGAAAALAAPLSTSGPTNGRYRAYFECALPGGASPQDRLIAHAAYPDPETGLPAINPETGQPVTMSKYFTVDVADGRAPRIIAADATVPQDRILHHTLLIDEVAGEPVTVTVKWPDLANELTYQTTAAQITISWRARAAVGTHPVQVTVTDGETPLQTMTFNVTVTAGQPPEIVGAEGPEFPAVGVATNYYFSAKAPALGTLVPVSSSCGVGGNAHGGVWFIKTNADGSQQFAVRCTFFQRGPSEVSVTFQSSSSTLVTGRLDVIAYVKGVPDLIWMEAATNPIVGKKATYYYGVRDRDGGDVTMVGASCGSQGAVTAGPTWTRTDPDGTESWGVQCLFGMPGESVIAMTFRGDSGAEVTYTQTASIGGIADQPPQIVGTEGPATPEPAVDASYAFTVWDSSKLTAQDPTCGTGQIVSGPTLTGFGANASRIFTITCNFGSVGASQVSLTFADADGGPATTGTITVNVRPRLPIIDVTDVTVPATGMLTPVTFAVSVQHATSVTCAPQSGSPFPLGSTTVSCTAFNGSSEATAAFNVNVFDSVAPILTLDAPALIEATGPGGAALIYSVSAFDAISGPVTPTCNVAPGVMVAVGASQTVECAAADASHNRSTGTRTVSVRDSIPPTIASASSIQVPATSAEGALVSFDAPLTTDIVDGQRPSSCVPTSGSLMPIGTTVVTCTAQDSAQNMATPVTFTVTVTPPVTPPVRDRRAPRLDLPQRIRVEADTPAGTVVTFSASAHDAVDGAVPVACYPASGSVFPLGRTTVRCSARDQSGNERTGQFEVVTRDTIAPEIRSLTPSKATLPATGARVPVTVAVGVFDAADAAPHCTIANVTSNVRDADRDGERDWTITGPLSLSLEAATRRHRDRNYRITVRCVDDSQNASRERTAVVVSRMQ